MKFRIKSNQSVGNAVVKNLEAHGYNSMGDPLKKEDEDSIDVEIRNDSSAILISVLNDLSNSIKELTSATINQKPPIVINLITSSDEDLKKFATIFTQGIK